MLSAVSDPVIAPSANLAGKRSPRTAQEVLDALDGRIDLLIDSGPTSYGKNSTIVKFDHKGWKIVRRGVFDAETIGKLMRRTILFVCTGNTCRSPMAAGIAKKKTPKEAKKPPWRYRKRRLPKKTNPKRTQQKANRSQANPIQPPQANCNELGEPGRRCATVL